MDTDTADNTFIVAEIDSGLLVGEEKTGNLVMKLIYTNTSLNEKELADTYESKICKFSINGRIFEGECCFATKSRSALEAVIAEIRKVYQNGGLLRTYVLRQATDTINHELVLNVIPRDQYPNDQDPKIKTLIQHIDLSYMENVLLFFKSETFEICNDDDVNTSLRDVKEGSWQLVLYSISKADVTFKVLSFSDTIWHDINHFKDAVSYIRIQNNTYRAVVVYSSICKEIVLKKFERVKYYIENVKIPLPYEINIHVDEPAAVILKRPDFFQRAEEMDTGGQRRILRNKLDQVLDNNRAEAATLVKEFVKIRALKRNLLSYIAQNNISLGQNRSSTESSANSEEYQNNIN